MKPQLYIAALLSLFFAACGGSGKHEPSATVDRSRPAAVNADTLQKVDMKEATPAEVIARQQVPILCYHRIRPYKASDSKRAKDYIVTPEDFRAQMKILSDSGYKAILPDQLMDYLKYGKAIPAKAVMLTFDDNVADQIEVARPVLEQYGFKGVYFIMTVTLGKPGYMSREQVKQLHDEGNVIGSHTYDHQNMKKLPDSLWAVQVDKPQKQLKDIIGEEVKYFAYPFGLWKTDNAPALQQRGLVAAFQLTEMRDPEYPLYTIRRMIVPGGWTADQMMKRMRSSFQ